MQQPLMQIPNQLFILYAFGQFIDFDVAETIHYYNLIVATQPANAMVIYFFQMGDAIL